MGDWNSDSEHGSDNEEELAFHAITYVLIAIDCDNSMFERKEEEQSTFKTALRTCYDILDQQLMKGGKRGFCPIAIVVATDDSKEKIICDFKDNLPASLKKLRELCEDSDASLESKYKRDGPMQMSNFLLQSKTKLSSLGQEYRKYIAYITKCDNPTDDTNDLRLSVNQAKSFPDFNIFIELMTFNEAFAYEAFFQEILEAAKSKFHGEYLTDSIDLHEKLSSLLSFRGNRAYFFVFPGKNIFFEIIEKRFIKQHKILNNIIVTKDTHTEVKQIKKGIELKNTYSLRVKRSPMPLSEVENKLLLSDNIPVGFTLLGTHRGDMFELGYQCRDPKFIQQNKSKNSPYFDIFWQYCVDKEFNLICARKYKSDLPTRIVQLTPKLINNVRRFLVLGIPYFNDIKYQNIHNANYESKSTDDENIKEAAEYLVNALDFQYDVHEIHDTVNCRKWEYIRSEVLGEEVREVQDVRELEVVQQDVSEVVNRFKELTFVRATKRKAPAQKRASKKK